MAEAPGDLIGSPSVSGTEQMSEQKDQSPFASKFTFCPLSIALSVTAALNVCVCQCVRAAVLVHVTFPTLADTGPSGADCPPCGLR